MKFSEQWLREWVDPPIGTDELVAQLTSAGLEVDAVDRVSGPVAGVVVAEIISAERHPDADRLQVCQVSVGSDEHLQIVCGAPNARAGLRAPLATIGASLGEGFVIKKSKLRGVESHGMLCSAKELGLSDASEGLFELPIDAPVGESIDSYLVLADNAIDVDLTPNRGDCLSIAGIAREVGVLNQCPVSECAVPKVEPTISDTLPVALDAPEHCSRYTGRVVRNIDAGAESPVWLREKLRRGGLRSISLVVDITNYVLLELGQPMHAFDLAKLEGGIQVRLAEQGEPLTLLDGQSIELMAGTLVIADHARPVAMAGIMGGLDAAVTDETRDIFFESAYFRPETLAGEARNYRLHTDSSHRFERGVDPALQAKALERATALLIEIAGGEPGPVIDESHACHVAERDVIRLRRSQLKRLLGIEVPDDVVTDVLTRLGLQVTRDADGWTALPPSWRFDLQIEADLIEEVIRIHGYDAVPSNKTWGALQVSGEPEARVERHHMRRVLIERGYQEAITYSFVDPAVQSLLDPEAQAIELSNPISADMSVMRTGLWTGLLGSLVHNVNRQQDRVRLFESGLVFKREAGETTQTRMLGGICTGPVLPVQWADKSRIADFYEIKSDVESLLALTGRKSEFSFTAAVHPALHPGQSATISDADGVFGWLGRLHPTVEQGYKLSHPVFVFELDLGRIEDGKLPKYTPLSKFPAMHRDIAVIVDESINAQAVGECIGQAGADVLKNFELFDVYRGEGIDSGKKSLAVGLTFQTAERTLSDAEVDQTVTAIVGALDKNFGAILRG